MRARPPCVRGVFAGNIACTVGDAALRRLLQRATVPDTGVVTLLHWQHYVALGDPRPWSALLAAILEGNAELRGTGFEFSDLGGSPDGLGDLVNVQVPRAIALESDLASIVVGASDLARPGVDAEALAEELAGGVASLRSAGCDVLLVTSAEPRFALFNAHLWSIARSYDAVVVDLWGARETQARSVACRAAHALGVPYFESHGRGSTVDFGNGFKR